MKRLSKIFILVLIFNYTFCLAEEDKKENFTLKEPEKPPEVSVSQPYPKKPAPISSNLILAEPVIASPVETEE